MATITMKSQYTFETIKDDIAELIEQHNKHRCVVRKFDGYPTKYDKYFDYLNRDLKDPIDNIIQFTENNFTLQAFHVFKHVLELEGRFIAVAKYEYGENTSIEKTTLLEIFKYLQRQPTKTGFIVGVVTIKDVDIEENAIPFGFKISKQLLKTVMDSDDWVNYKASQLFEGCGV